MSKSHAQAHSPALQRQQKQKASQLMGMSLEIKLLPI